MLKIHYVVLKGTNDLYISVVWRLKVYTVEECSNYCGSLIKYDIRRDGGHLAGHTHHLNQLPHATFLLWSYT